MDDSLSVILPVFNEEKNIKSVLRAIFGHIPEYIKDFEVIAINDGSSDNTGAVLDGIKRSFENLNIVSHDKNRGYGYALRSGIMASDKEWVLIMDSDGQFKIDDLKELWMKKGGDDFILGFRKKRNDNPIRSFLGRAGNVTASLLLRRRIKDINCGFKLFKRRELQEISLCSSGGIISFEILYRLFKAGKDKFEQYPVDHYPRKYGTQTGGAFNTVIKIIYEGTRILIK